MSLHIQNSHPQNNAAFFAYFQQLWTHQPTEMLLQSHGRNNLASLLRTTGRAKENNRHFATIIRTADRRLVTMDCDYEAGGSATLVFWKRNFRFFSPTFYFPCHMQVLVLCLTYILCKKCNINHDNNFKIQHFPLVIKSYKKKKIKIIHNLFTSAAFNILTEQCFWKGEKKYKQLVSPAKK